MSTHTAATILTNQQMSHIESSVEIIRSDLFSLKDEPLSDTAGKRVDQLLTDADDLYCKLRAIIDMS
jgi:hypothetical protein